MFRNEDQQADKEASHDLKKKKRVKRNSEQKI